MISDETTKWGHLNMKDSNNDVILYYIHLKFTVSMGEISENFSPFYHREASSEREKSN